MLINELKLLIEVIKLKIQIAQIQLQILLFKEKLTVPNLPGPKYIVIHHSGNSGGFEQTNQYHKTKWGFRSSLNFWLGYHYWIDFYGVITQSRRDTEEAAHTVEANRPGFWNKNSLGIALQGNFENQLPTANQLKSLEELLNKKMTEYQIPRTSILGHRNISPTLCPGKNLYSWLMIFKGRI